MVSLANGNTDVLSDAIVDSVAEETDKSDCAKEQNNVTSDQEPGKRIWYHIVAKKGVIDSNEVEVTDESLSETSKSASKNVLVENIVSAMDKSEAVAENTENISNGSDDPSLSSSSDETLVNGNRSKYPDMANVTPIPNVSSNNIGNLFFVGNLKPISKGDNQRKVFFFNNGALKETGTTDMPSDQSINEVLKKMKVVSSNADVRTLGSTTSVPSFVQLSQSNMKNISKNITLNVTPTTANPVLLKSNKPAYEILRSKLMENKVENSEPIILNRFKYSEPMLLEIPTASALRTKSTNKTTINAPQTFVNKHESSAITEARNEFVRCRKKLIEAAIFPKLPPKVPLPDYVGPIFTCDECEDTFTSEESLNNHKDRRCVLFTYNCPTCQEILEFYNRCMFLLHVRNHDSAVKACFLTISTIPASKLKFQVLSDDEPKPTKPMETVLIPTPAGKLLTKSAEKPVDFSTVRIVKSLRKKKPSLSTIMDEDTNDKLAMMNDEPSSLRSLLTNDIESSRDKSPSSRDKSPSSRDKSPEETIPPAPEPVKSSPPKRKKSSEGVVTKSKPVLKKTPSAAPVDPETNSSPEVTDSEVKRKTPTKNSSANNNVNVGVEEIALSSSDEEEDSLPDMNDDSKLVTCRDCKKDVFNLTQHYRDNNRPKKEYACEQCKYFNTSACALSAHIRMHTKTQPYVCPDCGYFFSTLETFLVHVKQVCFYDFKAIRFKCPVCSVLKPSVPKFAEHLRREHTREVFKCDACMTSSYSSAVVEAHIEKMHQNPDKISILEGYWCKLCPNMLVSKPLISHHINKHVYSLQYLRYVYICKMCKNYASLRRSKFANHYHNMCSELVGETIEELKVKKPNRIRKRSIESSKKNCKSNGTVVEKDSLSMRNGEADKPKKTEEGSSNVNLCVMCRKTKVNENASLFCRQCVRLVDVDDANSSTGITNNGENVSRLKRKFKCKLCKQYMNRDWSIITKHFETYHQSDFDVRTKMRNSSADANSVMPARKRKIPTKTSDNSAKISKADSKYKCAKCNITANGRKLFHEHITTHKSQSDFQCLECGLCFIVRLSLEKHLIVEHKIRPGDLKEYFKTNGIEVDDEKKLEEQALLENQCEVCRLECGSKQNYDKHIRTHGMAFVAMQSKAKS